jgi:IPT/TIG domain
MHRLRLSFLAVGIAAALGVLTPGAAQGAVVTIGTTQTTGLSQTGLGSPGSITVANLALGKPGDLAASPVNGVIVRWRITEASGGPFSLRVLRPLGAVQFFGATTSAPEIPLSTATQTFTTSLPIQKGDLIGLNTTNKTDQVGAIAMPGSVVAAWAPPLADGTSRPPDAIAPPGAEISLSADVYPVPAVTSVAPASGSIAGGTQVTIAGTDFSGATLVRFGEVPAATLPVTSDTQITAIAPKVSKPGAVDVTVVTPGGQSAAVAGDMFTYTACVVPKLKRKKLKAVRRALKKANCKLGKVRGEGKRVVKQAPKPRVVRPPGKKVNVKLG